MSLRIAHNRDDSSDESVGLSVGGSCTAFDPEQFLLPQQYSAEQLLDLSGRDLTTAGLQSDVLFFQNATTLDVSRNALTAFPLISWQLQSLTLSHNR